MFHQPLSGSESILYHRFIHRLLAIVNDAQIGSHLVEVLFDHATDEALADIFTSYFAGSAGTLDFLDFLDFLAFLLPIFFFFWWLAMGNYLTT